MRRALAAGLLWCALALAAQAPPVPEPAPPADAKPPVVPVSEAQPAQNPPPDTGLGVPAVSPPPRPPKPHPAPAPAPPPPAVDAAHEAEVAQLRAEVNRLQSELDAARTAAVPPPPEETAAPPTARSPWGWLAGTAMLALGAGFFLGWRVLDRRIRRRFGGLRIY